MRAGLATTGVTSTADEVFQCEERVLTPGLAYLFEARGVIGASAHPVKILRNKRVIGLRQLKPINWLVAIVARICSYCQPNLRPDRGTKLCYILDVSNNNIWAGHEVWHSRADCMLHGRHDHRFRFTPNNLVDLDRSHRRADGNYSGQGAS